MAGIILFYEDGRESSSHQKKNFTKEVLKGNTVANSCLGMNHERH